MELTLNSEEKAIVELSDSKVEELLESTHRGDYAAKDKIHSWAYLTAYHYYRSKLPVEPALSLEDAEELTTAFFLEFERTLPKLKSVPGFTRHVLKKNLNRYIRRKKKRRFRETLTAGDELDQKAENPNHAESGPWNNWTDEEFLQYQAVLEARKDTDEITDEIIQFRIEDPPLPYKEIAHHLNMSETAIRMRVTRFYGLVRKKLEKVVT